MAITKNVYIMVKKRQPFQQNLQLHKHMHTVEPACNGKNTVPCCSVIGRCHCVVIQSSVSLRRQIFGDSYILK
jgi:hypothetical protein